MTIRSRILLGFAVPFLACLGLGLFALQQTSQFSGVIGRLGGEYLPHVTVLGDIRGEIFDYHRILLRHVIATSPDDIKTLESQLADEADLINSWFAGAPASFGSAQQRKLLASAEASWIAYRASVPRLIVASRTGRKAEAEAMVEGDSNDAYRTLIDTVNTMRQLTVLEAFNGVGAANKAYNVGWWLIVAAMGACAAVCAAGGLLTVSNVCRPLVRLTDQMRQVAGRDLEIDIAGRERQDEIGAMAAALEQFRLGLREADRIAATQAEEQNSRDQRTVHVTELVRGFDHSVGSVLQALTAAATQLDATACRMTGIAEDTSRQAGGSADAAREATSNVQTVAASAEELAASLREIAEQVGRSNHIVRQATEEARATDANVGELSEAASRIGEVVQLISSIAGQTNLLALNATIEAARAGEAGRGFAVVASEVKALANQTGRATEDIARQITAIQGSTSRAVEAIGRINGAITAVSEVAAGIAAAVEQQSAAVGEISRSAADAAGNTVQVSESVGTLRRMSGDTGTAAGQVLSAAGDLAHQSETLRAEVDGFLTRIRAA